MVNTSKYCNQKASSRNNTKASTSEIEWDNEDFCDESILNIIEKSYNNENINKSHLRYDEKYLGFDNNVGNSWIYPSNLPIRNYQFNIVRQALFKNTLVVLPTGLGKTFIAAVVMYNIYRWYPKGKVIFMAPTRPLVNQQIDACRKIMGMPINDIAEMTGKQNKKLRQELWQTKRIFFATPQVVQSDINDAEQNFPFNDVKLMVVDEAHKAKGRYAYSEVVQSIIARNQYFRVLALSATPGRRIADVAEVVQNLFISHIEIRWENSIDVLPYTHKKNVKTIVVPLDEKLLQIKNDFMDIIDPYVKSLQDNGVITGTASSLSRGWLIMEQKRFRETSFTLKHPNQSIVNTDFSICISLYHALELLERHGVRVFLNFFEDNTSDTNHNSSVSTNGKQEKFFVALNPKLKQFLVKLRESTGPNPFLIGDQSISKIPDNLDFGHPKFEMTKKCLIEHFEKENNSRAIIFCEYRESVLLIHRLLLQSKPLIRPKVFVGQGGNGNIRAVTQKQQIQIMSDFRNGISNTLIATSVAEEGIDVGEVDLIVCFDISTKNPTRFIQRIGRTGRKRQGYVIMLVTEGKEHAMVKEVLATKDKTNQKLAKSSEIQNILYKMSPRIVPPEYDPKCVQTFIKFDDNEQDKNLGKKGKTKRKSKSEEIDDSDLKDNQEPPIKKLKGRPKKEQVQIKNSNLKNFFKKIELDADEKEIFNVPQKQLHKSPKLINKDFDIHIIETKDVNLNHYNGTINELNFEKDNSSFKRAKCQNLIRKLSSFKRRLDGSRVDIETIKTPYDALLSKALSKNGKRFYLEQNYDYVNEKYEAIKAVEGIVKNDDDESTNEIINLKKEFSLIEDVFDGRLDIVDFLEKNRDIKMNINRKINNIQDTNKKFANLFNGLEKRDYFDNVQDYIEDRLKEINISSEEIEENEIKKNKSTFNCNSDMNIYKITEEPKEELHMDEFDFIESKYVDQFPQFKKDEIKMQSTPLRKELKPFSMPCSSPLTTILKKSNEELSVTSAHNSKKFIEKYDFFDDDFDEILATSTNVFTEIEQKPNEEPNNNDNTIKVQSNVNIPKEEIIKNEKDDIMSNSMISIDQIWNIIDEKENIPKDSDKSGSKKINVLNSELEDFDLDEFLEDNEFNLPEEVSDEISNNVSSNLFDETTKENTKFGKNIEKQTKMLEIINISKELENLSQSIVNNRSILENNKTKENQLLPDKTTLNQSPKCINTSPSILRRNINFSKLKFFNSDIPNSSNQLNTNINDINKDNIRNTKNFLEKSSLSNTSLLDRLNNKENQIDESVIGIANNEFSKRKNKRIIESSSDSSKISPSDDEDFKSNIQKKKPTKRKFKRRKCNFLLTQAECNEEGDSEEDIATSQNALDSIVVSDEEVPLTINMQAKYLQSIRNLHNRPGAFKIPSDRLYKPLSQICSQSIFVDDETDIYKEDSFVVSDEEEIKDNEINETCPLERAEAILKARRKEKTKNLNKRKRIIYQFQNSSDEEI